VDKIDRSEGAVVGVGQPREDGREHTAAHLPTWRAQPQDEISDGSIAGQSSASRRMIVPGWHRRVGAWSECAKSQVKPSQVKPGTWSECEKSAQTGRSSASASAAFHSDTEETRSTPVNTEEVV
jgi:hypothetical protein